MRTLCLLLLLVNALFFGWSQLIDVQANDLQRRPTSSTPPARIMLAREAAAVGTPQLAEATAPPASTSAPAATPATVTPPAARPKPRPVACTSVGPFAEASEAATAIAALRKVGFQPRQRMVQGEMWVGYWVNVQGLPQAEADAAVKMLLEKGMTDVYVLTGAGNLVSLGIFTDYQRAQRRLEEARSFGLDARINDRKRNGSVHWIDIDQTDTVIPIDTSLFQTDPGKIMRLEITDCPGT